MKPPAPLSAATVAVALLALTAACTPTVEPAPRGPTSLTPSPSPVATQSPTPLEPLRVTVAFVEALEDGEPVDRVTAAYQASRLAFSNAELVGGLDVDVEVVLYDTEGDPARTAEIAAEIGSTPEVVAAIGAPGLTLQGTLGDALTAAGVPWLSLSGIGRRLGERGWTGWRRLVADDVTQGSVLGGTVDGLRRSRRGVCAMDDGSASAHPLMAGAARALDDPVSLRATVGEGQADVADAATAVGGSGCGVVLWGGDEGVGAALRRQLVEDGLARVGFAGSDRIRDRSFLEAVGPAGEGTIATCPCVDLSTSFDLAAQRFIQDYQSEFGLPPGPYAVEGWDAARMLVAALRAGSVTRAAISADLTATTAYDGLAATYTFDAAGDLADASETVRISHVEGGRWLEVGSTSAAA